MEASVGPRAIKRQRSENWLEEDKVLLRELVRERVGILENKKADTNTNAMKVEAWLELQSSFNCMCKGVQRTLTQLKGQHKMLKANERKELNETGSGTPPTSDTSESHDMLYKFDSVQTSSSSPNVTIKEENNENTEVLPLEVDAAEPNLTSPPEQSTPKPLNRKYKRYRRNTISATARVAAIEVECRKELHKAQMKNEKLKAYNLTLEEVLLKTKIKYYQTKIINNNFD